MVSGIEKNIYNTYLRISRTARNKPFSYRKNFDNLEDSICVSLHRINILLQKYPHIDPEDYFLAPYKVYPNEEYFEIEYFAGMGAINAYSIYMKQLQELPPDREEQLQFIKKSLRFLGMFCIKNKINISDYPTFKSGITYDWMKHVKMHQVSIYSLMDFPGISDIIQKSEQDEKNLFLGDISEYFWGYKSKYIQSKIAKKLVRKGIEKIENIINNKHNVVE